MMSGDMPGQVISGMDVAICALIHFYVHEEPLNGPGPLLTRTLAFTLRLILRIDAWPKQKDVFMAQLDAVMHGPPSRPAEDETMAIKKALRYISQLIDETRTLAGLHNFFTRAERLLLREEMYDDVQNLTIKPAERQIDESSPFGRFLQSCLEGYLTLEHDELARQMRDIQAWLDGKTRSTPEAIQLSPQEKVDLALRRGDYAAARACLEGSFDRPPAPMIGRSLPETLYHHAAFHVRTQAFDTAKESLAEALRLARGVNDTKCIAACDDLLNQIEFEEDRQQPRSFPTLPTLGKRRDFPLTLSHIRDARRTIDEGHASIALLAGIQKLQTLSKDSSTDGSPFPHESVMSLDNYDLMLGEIWQEMGSSVSAETQVSANSEALVKQHGWHAREQNLAHRLYEARSMSEAGHHAAALLTLVDRAMLSDLDISMLHMWHSETLKALYRAAINAGSDATADAIEKLKPEVENEALREPKAHHIEQQGVNSTSQATLVPSVKLTKLQELKAKLSKAHVFRVTADIPIRALSLAADVMLESKNLQLFSLHRQAACEVVMSQLSLGQVTRARAILEEHMPQMLQDSNPAIKGTAAFAFANLLIAGNKGKGEDLKQALQWLRRAESAFDACSMLPELVEVRYTAARVCHHLGDQDERDTWAQAHNDTLQMLDAIRRSKLAIFDDLLSITALASARIVAGG